MSKLCCNSLKTLHSSCIVGCGQEMEGTHSLAVADGLRYNVVLQVRAATAALAILFVVGKSPQDLITGAGVMWACFGRVACHTVYPWL